MAVKLPCGNQTCYLDRLPERLVVDGYRYWMAGYETGSIAPWELAWSLFADELGPADGRVALSALTCWVRTCRNWSPEPRQFFPFRCKRLCKDECLAVSLISALQHHDRESARFCLGAMVLPDGALDTESSAHNLAESLAALGQRLMPVPLAIIEDIAHRPKREQYH
jgi:hypothetical protein